MKSVYISGPITGLPLENKPAFDDMHQRIIDAGHIPFPMIRFLLTYSALRAILILG